MNTKVAVRIKRGESPTRIRVAARALELAGYRARTVRRNGHPVRVWTL